MTCDGDDWDDDRLDAAFRARSSTSHGLPDDTVDPVLRRLAPRSAGTRRSRTWFASAVTLGSALAAALVVAVQPSLDAPRASTQPTASITTASGDPSPAVPTGVALLLAHPLTVEQAMTRRDRALDDTEIAVRGWVFGPDATFDCDVPAGVPVIFSACQNPMTWLAADHQTRRVGEFDEPVARAFNVVMQPGTLGGSLGSRPREVIALGHFADHRAAGCPLQGRLDRSLCERAFVVDALVNPVSPVLEVMPFGEPIAAPDPDADPEISRRDAIVAAGIEPTSDRLLVAFAMRRSTIDQAEPGATATLEAAGLDEAWIVRFIGSEDGRPVVRTRIVGDHMTWHGRRVVVWDVALAGVTPLPQLEPDRLPTNDAFAGAPTSVFGIGVGSIATTLTLHPQRDAAEVAIRGWYVPPDPAASCPLLRDPIRPVGSPCNQGRHWLLAEPQQLWADPRKIDIDRQPSGPYLNPIVPFDVTIDVPSGWEDGSPEPWPVILLGHFADPRTTTQADRHEFTVDALVWQRGDAPHVGDPPQNTVAFQAATESEDVVRGRLDDQLGPAHATWLTVVSGAELQVVDPDVEPGRSDLSEAPVVWVARRLVDERQGDVVKRVVMTAMTVDGTDRIWARRVWRTLELTTPLVVPRDPADPRLLIEDHLGQVASATFDAPRLLTWRPIGPPEASSKAVAATGDPREVAIRWRPNICGVPERLIVTPDLWIGFRWELTDEFPCPIGREDSVVVLRFDRVIDVDAVKTDDVLSGG